MLCLNLGVSELQSQDANPAGVRAAEAAQLKKDRADLEKWLAEEHLAFAERFKTSKIYTGARLHAYRILQHAPDHAEARKLLGYKKIEGKWQMTKALPQVDDEETRTMLRARKTIGDDYGDFAAKAAKKITDLALRCGKAGQAAEAQELWWRVLLYDARDKTAYAARGFKEIDGVWLPSFALDAYREGARKLKDGREGAPIKGDDPQADVIGISFTKRKSNHFIARTTLGTARAKRIIKVANASANFTKQILGLNGTPVRNNPYTLTLVKERKHFSELYIRNEKESNTRSQIARNAQGAGTNDPKGYMTLQNGSEAAADDSVANSVALEVLMKYRTSGISAWLIAGFPYYVTANVLNSAITSRYEVIEKVGTRVFRRNNEKVVRGNPFAPEDFRLAIRELVRSGQDVPLAELAALKINEINEYHAAKSFSLIEYLFSQHQQAAREWLAKPDRRSAKEIEALAKCLKQTPEELEANWRAWVRKHY